MNKSIRALAATKHGHSFSPTYSSWSAMKKRCLNETDPSFFRYGARGIDFCFSWMDFTIFLEDMGERPNGMCLDRIDNDKGYSKNNCRWADVKTQSNNRRSNTIISYKNKKMTLTQAAELVGLSCDTLSRRMKKKWLTLEEALELPLHYRK